MVIDSEGRGVSCFINSPCDNVASHIVGVAIRTVPSV